MNEKQQEKIENKSPSHLGVKSPDRNVLLIALFALFIACASLAYMYFSQQQNHSLQESADEKISTFKVDMQKKIANIGQLQDDLSQVQMRQQEQRSQLENATTGLQRLMDSRMGEQSDWVLFESQYLLHLALFNSQYNHNMNSAVALLHAADERLQSLGEPGLQTVREVIAQDIQALKALPKVDIAGLIAQLNALSQQISTLPLNTAQTKQTVEAASEDKLGEKSEEQLSWWRKGLNETGKALQNIVVIRHHEQAIEPLLSKEKHNLLHQNFHLLLQQAQWAVLQQDNQLYQNSLAQAQTSIKQYYDVSDSATKSSMEQINALLKLNIAPDIPDVSQSLDALNHFIKKKQNTKQQQASLSFKKVKLNQQGE